MSATLIALPYYQSAMTLLGQGALAAAPRAGVMGPSVDAVSAVPPDVMRAWRTAPPAANDCAARYRTLLDGLRATVELEADEIGETVAALLHPDGSGDMTETLLEVFLARVAPRVAGTDALERLRDICPAPFAAEQARFRDGLALIRATLGLA